MRGKTMCKHANRELVVILCGAIYTRKMGSHQVVSLESSLDRTMQETTMNNGKEESRINVIVNPSGTSIEVRAAELLSMRCEADRSNKGEAPAMPLCSVLAVQQGAMAAMPP